MKYLATPYTKFFLGHDAAFKEAARITAALMRRGHQIFSPIVHGHPLSQYGGMPFEDHDFWMNVDRPFMDLCSECIVAKMPGWQTSKGVQEEVLYFLNRECPVWFLDTKTFEMVPALVRPSGAVVEGDAA